MKEIDKNEVLRIESSLVNPTDEKCMQKFHQKTKWNYINEQGFMSEKLLYYSEHVSSLTEGPKECYEEIPLKKYDFKVYGSKRDFTYIKNLNFSDFSEILSKSFGNNFSGKKSYASAGGIYSVFTLVYIFNNNNLEFEIDEGIYYFERENNSLQLIKYLDSNLKEEIKRNLSGETILGSLMFGYCINYKRSIAKYRLRGYRHVLIEVGSMVQNVRSILNGKNMGELCFSGFNDDNLTYLSGLNVRNSSIILLQWWG